MIARPSPPPAVILASVRDLRRFLESDSPLLHLLKTVPGSERHAQRIFLLGLADVIEGREVRQISAPVGWRFLARNSAGLAAAVWVTERHGMTPRIASIAYGDRVAEYFHATARVDGQFSALPGSAQQEYELRVLSIPCLLIEAFWALPPDGAGYVVPYKAMVRGLDPKTVYPVSDFLAICKPLAEARSAADDTPESGRHKSYGWTM